MRVCVYVCACNCNSAAMSRCAMRQTLISNTLCLLYKYLVAIININYALEIYTTPYMYICIIVRTYCTYVDASVHLALYVFIAKYGTA